MSPNDRFALGTAAASRTSISPVPSASTLPTRSFPVRRAITPRPSWPAIEIVPPSAKSTTRSAGGRWPVLTAGSRVSAG
jgi:hypothetical protein